MRLFIAWQWVIAGVLAVSLLATCNDSRSGNEQEELHAAAKPTTSSASQDNSSAQQAYAAGNCAMCHGADQAGTKLGPALSELSQHDWDANKLKEYLRDPKNHSVNPERLAALDGDYSMSMPAFTGSDEELDTLVEWLLTK